MTPRPVYFSHQVPRPANQPFMEKDPKYGDVYHVGSANDIMNLVNREQGLLYQTHPRTKNSSGYPDAVRNQDYFLTDRNIGGSWESLPVDQSEARICEKPDLKCLIGGKETPCVRAAPRATVVQKPSTSFGVTRTSSTGGTSAT